MVEIIDFPPIEERDWKLIEETCRNTLKEITELDESIIDKAISRFKETYLFAQEGSKLEFKLVAIAGLTEDQISAIGSIGKDFEKQLHIYTSMLMTRFLGLHAKIALLESQLP